MSKDTSGPAFPTIGYDGGAAANGIGLSVTDEPGMTLLDYFATKALVGLLSWPGDEGSGSYHSNSDPAHTASMAYEYGKAMLAARGEAMSGWIKCSERMPELPKGGGKAWVIAYTPARKAQSAFNGARFLYWNGIDWRYGDGSRFEHRVTHWQPHLTPPTE